MMHELCHYVCVDVLYYEVYDMGDGLISDGYSRLYCVNMHALYIHCLYTILLISKGEGLYCSNRQLLWRGGGRERRVNEWNGHNEHKH